MFYEVESLKQLPVLFPMPLKAWITEVYSFQQIRMAEIEQASLKSEQLSDKSSSPALPDDLSLDEHTAYQLLAQEGEVGISKVKRKDTIKIFTLNVDFIALQYVHKKAHFQLGQSKSQCMNV